jgi:hypothetical protein
MIVARIGGLEPTRINAAGAHAPARRSAVIPWAHAMSDDRSPPRAVPRSVPRSWAALLIVAALGAAALRVARVEGPLSDNDRSRWAAIHALLTSGEFAIGQRTTHDGEVQDAGLVKDPRYPSVDVVLDPETGRFFSSKPPLLPALVAAQCRVLGCTLDAPGARAYAVRAALALWSLAPIFVFLLVVARVGRGHPWLLALAGFGTFVTAFASTLNNHVPAAAACALVVLAMHDAFRTVRPPAWTFVLAGAAAGFCATQELPAVALLAAALALLATRDPRRTLLLALPPAVLMLAAAAAASHAAYGQLLLTPPRAWYLFDGAYWLHPTGIDVPDRSVLRYAFHFLVGHHGALSLTPAFGLAFVAIARAIQPRRIAVPVGVGVAILLCVRALAHALGAPWQAALVPAVLGAMVVLGWPWGWWRAASAEHAIARMSGAVSLMVLAFYLAITTNYGGVSMGPRWLLMLTPLWIAAMTPEVVALWRTPRGRALLAALLLLSVASATPHDLNPWVHPWLYEAWAP